MLNLVFGVPSDISGHLIPQDPVRLVAFTGSTAVGRHLTGLAARNDTRVLMELGGHAPAIVCEDTDVQAAAVAGAFRKVHNAGQVCTSPTRFFVHDRILDAFSDAFVTHIRATVVGNGMESGVEMGPTANDRRVTALAAFVEDAREKGRDHGDRWRQVRHTRVFLSAYGLDERAQDRPDHAGRAV